MALTDKEIKEIKYGVQKGIAQELTKSDSKTYDLPFNVYVGTGGDLKVETTAGNIITLKNVPSGTYIDWIQLKKISGKGTTASDIVAIY